MKPIQRFLGPPLNQVAVLFVLSTSVIEAMGDFVSDYRTNRTMVHVNRQVGVEVGWMKNAYRNYCGKMRTLGLTQIEFG